MHVIEVTTCFQNNQMAYSMEYAGTAEPHLLRPLRTPFTFIQYISGHRYYEVPTHHYASTTRLAYLKNITNEIYVWCSSCCSRRIHLGMSCILSLYLLFFAFHSIDIRTV